MPQMPIIQGLIEIACRVAGQRGASAEDVALGIVAALRRIHTVVQEASDSLALTMREMLRDVIIRHNLDQLRATEALPTSAPLPEKGGAAARLAVAVFEDAANSCLGLNALTPDNQAVAAAAHILLERLIQILGGAPDYRALIDRITDSAAGPPGALDLSPGPQQWIN